MVKILAVYDADPAFGERLADYVNQKEKIPFTAMIRKQGQITDRIPCPRIFSCRLFRIQRKQLMFTAA